MRRTLSPLAAAFVLAVAAACAQADDAPSIAAPALASRIAAGDAPRILDVRTPEEFARGHVPGALNVPYTELPSRLGGLGLAPGDEVVVYCERGPRAVAASEVLRGAGYTDVLLLEGHMGAWRSDARPCEGC